VQAVTVGTVMSRRHLAATELRTSKRKERAGELCFNVENVVGGYFSPTGTDYKCQILIPV